MLAACLAVTGPGLERPAWGYEFEVTAQTIGQGYQLRSFRLLGGDLSLSRRRFTQTLSLNIWDLGGRVRDRRLLSDRRGDDVGLLRGPNLYITTYLRLDHDFGAWSTGSLVTGVSGINPLDAVDLVPELENGLIALDVLYGYAAAEDLAGGWLDVYAGRLLEVGALDWTSFDGIKLRADTSLPISLVAFGGLRVREATPTGSATFAPDGTGGAECAEYVEGRNPGSGSWRPIDREEPIENNPFENELDRCPQRDQVMPTFGGAIETRELDWLWARLDYRRAVSRPPGLIGPVDRFEFADQGFYPDEIGQTPEWGVNEELLSASVRGNHRFGGGWGQLTPYAAARLNLLLGRVDQAHAGVRLRHGGPAVEHAIEPEVYYSFPSFDGDSIFNVFSSRGYVDARMTYDATLRRISLAAYARTWVRRFAADSGMAPGEDPPGDDPGDPGMAVDGQDLAGGVQVGARYGRRSLSARVDLFVDGGHGGGRTGGYASGQWQVTRDTGLRARVSVIHLDGPEPLALEGRAGDLSLGVQAGASYRINTGVTVHVIAEENRSRFGGEQVRVMGMLDLAFVPEV